MATHLLPLLNWRSSICDSDLPSTTRHVALAVSLYMNERGASAYPGAERLAKATGLSVRAVREHLHALVEAGWLVLVTQGGVRGEQRSANEYAAAVPIVTGDPALPMQESALTPADDDRDPCTRITPSLQELCSNSSLGAQAPRKRGSRIPEKFTVTDEMADWAEADCPLVQPIMRETQQFADYWKSASGRTAVKVDWPRAWKVWMRKAQKDEERRKSFGPAQRTPAR